MFIPYPSSFFHLRYEKSGLGFELPGGGSGRVCTRQVLYPDGRQFVGQGIQPDILVPTTLADFRARRDAVLDRALEYLSH